MTTPFGRVGGGFPQWVQEVQDRLDRLEGRKRFALGDWVLEQVDGDVVLTYVPTGQRQQLAAPADPTDPNATE